MNNEWNNKMKEGWMINEWWIMNDEWLMNVYSWDLSLLHSELDC